MNTAYKVLVIAAFPGLVAAVILQFLAWRDARAGRSAWPDLAAAQALKGAILFGAPATVLLLARGRTDNLGSLIPVAGIFACFVAVMAHPRILAAGSTASREARRLATLCLPLAAGILGGASTL
ncbi:hypothetical protein [Kitasatospora sp. NPDC089509]|uniref:hypothetical protein n=1 Tax=Kitasatospora sp. NPDC089509 TaxID=3364079 RepID=UPI0038090E32